MPHNFELSVQDSQTYTKIVHLGLWKDAKDLKTIFDLNKLYISGQLTIHPGHGIPLYAESGCLQAKLLEMNEYGLFTFQGQPRTAAGEEEFKPPHDHEDGRNPVMDKILEPSNTKAYCACCACVLGCWADCSKSCYKRQVPYVQFCMPVDDEGDGLTTVCAARLIEALLEDDRVHVQVSWPKGLDILYMNVLRWGCKWTKADLTFAQTYIAQEDLDLFHHFKSLHGNSCPQEILTTSVATAPGAWSTEPDMADAGWRPIREDWSQVNDYHLLLPRVPDFFLGPGAKTVVFGVNAVKWDGGIEDMETFILNKVKALGLKKIYPTMPENTTESEQCGETDVRIPRQIDFEDWSEEDSQGSWELL